MHWFPVKTECLQQSWPIKQRSGGVFYSLISLISPLPTWVVESVSASELCPSERTCAEIYNSSRVPDWPYPRQRGIVPGCWVDRSTQTQAACPTHPTSPRAVWNVSRARWSTRVHPSKDWVRISTNFRKSSIVWTWKTRGCSTACMTSYPSYSWLRSSSSLTVRALDIVTRKRSPGKTWPCGGPYNSGKSRRPTSSEHSNCRSGLFDYLSNSS